MDTKRLAYEMSRIALKMLPLGRTTDDIFSLIYRVTSSQRDLDQQVEEAMEALSNSSQLIAALEQSLEERARRLNELKAEYDRVSKLAEITEEQGRAVAETLENLLGKRQTQERWIAFSINIAAGLLIFLLGVFASDWVRGIPDRVIGGSVEKPHAVSSPSASALR